MKTRFMRVLLAFVLAMASSVSVAQTDFPSKPIRLLVGFPAGGSTDVVARALAHEVRKPLGQEIVVVNRPGASGVIAVNDLIAANPDGYTINLSPSSAFTLGYHFMDIRPDLLEATSSILMVASQRSGLVTRSNSPQRTLKEFVAYARKNPGRVSIGIPGKGTKSELLMMAFAMKEKLDVSIVPFQGDAPIITSLLGGHIAAASFSAGAWMSQLSSGAMRLLASNEEERFDLAPDVPTLVEMGYSLTGGSIQSLYGPKGLPARVLERLVGAFTEATRSPGFIEIATKNGVYEKNLLAGAELERFLLKDRATNTELVEMLGLKKKP